MLDEADLRRSDLLSGALIILVGVAVVVGASQMPMGGTYGGVDNPWYASPGAVPLFLGCLFCALGGGIVFHGWQRGGGRNWVQNLVRRSRDREGRLRSIRVLALWGGLLGYVLMLSWKPFGAASLGLARVVSPEGHLGFLTEPNGVNYWIATAVYLSLFVFAFGRRGGARSSV